LRIWRGFTGEFSRKFEIRKRVLTDGRMTHELDLMRGNLHAEGLLMAYIPKQKLLIQAFGHSI